MTIEKDNIYSETLSSGSWVLETGDTYYQDIAHNLGSTDLIVSTLDSFTKSIVLAQQVTLTDSNNLRVKVRGNTLDLRVTITSGISGLIETNTAVLTALSTNTTLNTSTHRHITVDTSGGDVTLTLPLSADSLWEYDIWKITNDAGRFI